MLFLAKRLSHFLLGFGNILFRGQLAWNLTHWVRKLEKLLAQQENLPILDYLWHSQPLDRVTPPWLANPRPPAMSPHAKGTRHLSHWFNSGRIKGGRGGSKRMIQRLNEENGRCENTVLSTSRRCKQGWPCLSQTTDRWPRSRSLLLTLLNKYLFNLIQIFLLDWREKIDFWCPLFHHSIYFVIQIFKCDLQE